MISQGNFTKALNLERKTPGIETFYSKPFYRSGFDLRLYYSLLAGILLVPVLGLAGFAKVALGVSIILFVLFLYILISPYERYNCSVVIYEDHFKIHYLLRPQRSMKLSFEHIESNVLVTKQERLYNEILDLNIDYNNCFQRLNIPMRKPVNEVLRIREIITHQVNLNLNKWN